MTFKYKQKVTVSGIKEVGIIVGKADHRKWIVLYDEPPYDEVIKRKHEFPAMVIFDSCIEKVQDV